MAEWIEFTDEFGTRTVERTKNIISIFERGSGTRVFLNYTFSDGSNFYDVSDSYDSIKEKLMGGETNG